MSVTKVTIADIAREAGVDKSTVSIVMNRRPLAERLKQETKDRILEASVRLNYNPSFMARSLSSGKTQTFGIVVGDIHTPHFAELVAAALAAADEVGYQMLIYVTQWNYAKESKALNGLMQRQVDGIIHCPHNLHHDRELYKHIISIRYPVVLLHGDSLPGLSSVCSEYGQAMRAVAAHFRARGHSRIGYMEYAVTDGLVTLKEQALRQAAAESGLTVENMPIHGWGPEAIEQLAAKCLEPGAPKALLVCSDYVAVQLQARLLDAGKRIPEDFELVGIDGTEWASFCRPAMPFIRQDRTALMAKSIELLLEMNENADWQPRKITVPTYLQAG